MSGPPDGFLFVAEFLAPAEQTPLLAQLQALSYTHDRFRGQRLKRGYAQFGYAYVSTGRKLEVAEPMPEFLALVIARLGPFTPEAPPFQQCIVTHYPPNAGIGWHVDAPRFGPCVAGVTLGAAGRFQFRPTGSDEVSYEVKVTPGSMYLMRGASRWDFQHQVVPVKADRYSLTFRHVKDDGE